MKIPAHSILLLRSGVALTLALFIWTPVRAQSAAPAEGKMMMDGKMMEPPQARPESPQAMTEPQQAMMQHHQAMMADMKSQDAELTTQLATMNRAPADQKLDLMAAIVTRLVEQRTAMNARMGAMQGEMMKCSMQDMPMGANAPSPPPMRNGMEGKMGEAKK